MKKVVDYLDEQKQLLEEYLRWERGPKTEQENQKSALFGELVQVMQSQYKESYDMVRRRIVEDVYFPAVCEVASIFGGRAELEILEEIAWAEIRYIGVDCVLDEALYHSFEPLWHLIRKADLFQLHGEDDRFVLEYMFRLIRLETVADHSDEIRRLVAKIKEKKRDIS